MYKKKFYINIFLYKLCVKFAHNAVLHIVYKNNLQESCDIYLYNNCKQFYIKKKHKYTQDRWLGCEFARKRVGTVGISLIHSCASPVK